MAKPDWKDAPSWAEWLAQDEDGTWFWYEDKPTADEDCLDWEWAQSPHFDEAGCGLSNPNWRTTLERRPESRIEQEGHGTARGDSDAKSEAIRRAIEVTAGPGIGSLTLSVDTSELREVIDDAIREARESGELPDLIIKDTILAHVPEEGEQAIVKAARLEGYRIEWDSNGIRGWKE